MRILVVDDAPDVRGHIVQLLKSGGFEDVHEAGSAAEALGYLGVNGDSEGDITADLILLDVRMPEMDGLELCARIKSDPRYLDIPVLMVTAMDAVDILHDAFMAGAMDYLTKPVSQLELLARVRSAIKLKNELDRRRILDQDMLEMREVNNAIDEDTGLPEQTLVEKSLIYRCNHFPGSTACAALRPDATDYYLSEYGQEAHNELLKNIVTALTDCQVPLGSLIGYAGYGAFCIMLPIADAKLVRTIAGSWCRAVRDLGIPHAYSPTTDVVTLSVGLSVGASDAATTLDNVWTALEQAHSDGGDRVVEA